MAQITSEGAEQDSQPAPDQNGTGETAETGTEGQAVPDPKQEPGDNNENIAGMDVNTGRGAAAEHGDNQSPVPEPDKETAVPSEKADSDEGEPGGKLSEPGKSPVQGSLASSTDSAQEGSRVLKQEQREGESVSSSPPTDRTKTAEKAEQGTKRRASVELTSSDGEPLSRMDSEDSISSTLMDMESTASSGRSTPAMLNGHGGGAVAGSGSAPAGGKSLSYTCCWDHCQLLFPSSPDLAEHIRATHVDGQRGGCVVGGCNATFASQGGLARHVPTHFSSQARPHDFFDAQTMDAIRHRAICLNLATHIESLGNGHSVVFHSTVIARRKEDSGKVKVLLHWTPEDM
ncbi:Zinc finger protein AEBP2 [Nibea albiflora]|uniref:Zinc finger protein AEBP2 n=1 Tax=Nibea albiflora TaxID=240163 RepID=A0ACB7EUC0_NIBAL|nr:Zinc finger protein AEBP2 [Nibea albiflora]